MLSTGYKANIISTIRRYSHKHGKMKWGYKAYIISTIRRYQRGRGREHGGYKANIISTIRRSTWMLANDVQAIKPI